MHCGLADWKIGIGGGIFGEIADVPFCAIAERVFHDEHSAIIIAGIHQVGVRNVANEAIFIEFVRINRQVAEILKSLQENWEIGFVVARVFFGNDEDEIRSAVIKP